MKITFPSEIQLCISRKPNKKKKRNLPFNEFMNFRDFMGHPTGNGEKKWNLSMQIDIEIKEKEEETETEMVRDGDNEDKGDRKTSI